MQTAPARLPAEIFRAYDIRGTYGRTLDTDTAYWIGRAVGAASLEQDEPRVVIARDGRLSGPVLLQALAQGLLDAGCDVLDLGLQTTPLLYFATHDDTGSRSGIMLTGSHNPPDHNGFKVVLQGQALYGEQIQALHQRLLDKRLSQGHGQRLALDVSDRYRRALLDDIHLLRPLHVVVDAGNGVAGGTAPGLLRALGCRVSELYCEIDGHFPNHHPDPCQSANLAALVEKVRAEQADLGLAFDGDGDRLGVVTASGRIIAADQLLMLFARDILQQHPGSRVVFDVKCTRHLSALVEALGGEPLMWKTGHSLIKRKMLDSDALLAGEMTGHLCFRDRWFGFDDALYAAARLLELLARQVQDSDSLFAGLGDSLSTPEINLPVDDRQKFQLIETLQRDARWGEGCLTTIDGIRVDFAKGWGLVRASNTTPSLVLRFEADDADELARIQAVFRSQLNAIAPELPLNF